MNLKDLVIARIQHQETDRVPCTLGFEGDVDLDLDAYYGSREWRSRLQYEIVPIPLPMTGLQVDIEEGVDISEREQYADAYGSLWRMDCVIEEDIYDELLERMTVHHPDLIHRLMELPLDGIMLSGKQGCQHSVLIGAERWRKFLKPRLARLDQRVHEAGKIALNHCCGSVAEIPELIDIELDVLESVQPEAVGINPYALKKQYGEHITFWGGLGSQSIIPFGTPAALTAEINKLAREMSVAGGYILPPAKDLQPGNPVENASAILETFINNPVSPCNNHGDGLSRHTCSSEPHPSSICTRARGLSLPSS